MTIVTSAQWMRSAAVIVAASLLVAFVAAMALDRSARAAEVLRFAPAASTGGTCPGALTPPPAPSKPPGPPGQRLLARVSFQSQGGLVVLPVRVNDSRAFEMVLDTGMTAPIVFLTRPEVAEKLGLKGGQPILIGGPGAGEPRRGSVIQGARVSIGDLDLEDQTLIGPAECGAPSPCIQDGVIGKSIFDRYLVEIDFESSVVSIYEGEIADPRGFVSLPLDLDTGIPRVKAEVELEGGKRVPVLLILDLGARHALSLFFNEEKGIVAPRKALEGVVGRGMQGEVPGKIGRLSTVHFGGAALRGVVASFTDAENLPACTSPGDGADGNLGIEILRRFRLVFDYPRRRLLLKPASSLEDPFEYNMAGLSLEMQQDGSYRVRSVVAGSPGDEAGLARGDVIVGIEDRVLARGSKDENAGLFQRDGTSLKVKVERDGSRFDRTLKLRRLI